MNDIQISEKKLEDFVFNHLTGEMPVESLPFDNYYDCVFRQFDLGRFGIVDIIGFSVDYDGKMFVDIYELKKDNIGSSALIQILKYKKGIEHFFYRNRINIEHLSCCLIGGGISHKNDFSVALSNTIDFLSIYVYDICPNTGLKLIEQTRIFTIQNLPKKTKSIFSYLDYKSKDQLCKFVKHEKERDKCQQVDL